MFQKQSIDFKTFFSIFTRFQLKISIQLNTVCVQYYMHITILIESFKAFTILIFAIFQHKSKIQKKNIKYKKRNIFLNKQLISANNNYLRIFLLQISFLF